MAADLVALGAAPFYAHWLAGERTVGTATVLAIHAIGRHAANSRRLLAGAEPRIGEKAEKDEGA